MRAAALLLGAGRGERLEGDAPKAFAAVAGRTLLELVVAAIDASPGIEGFVVAAPRGWEARARSAAGPSAKLLEVVAGGETRQASARRALAAVPASFDAVVCHDVARPFASAALFAAVLNGLGSADGVVPAVPLPDTVKRIDDGRVAETLRREGLVIVQTPQAFRREPLEAAHRAAEAEGFEGTDDAALLERAGFPVVVVPGDPANLKITRPDDLRVASLLAGGRG
jgi:2-C-methyl-D-erythritol 4-phosphate cytidylyltransferase